MIRVSALRDLIVHSPRALEHFSSTLHISASRHRVTGINKQLVVERPYCNCTPRGSSCILCPSIVQLEALDSRQHSQATPQTRQAVGVSGSRARRERQQNTLAPSACPSNTLHLDSHQPCLAIHLRPVARTALPHSRPIQLLLQTTLELLPREHTILSAT